MGHPSAGRDRIAGTAAPEPGWLSAWRTGRVGPAEALSRFDALPGLAEAEMIGRWRGASLPTGHPLDGLLEALGWEGKLFESPDRVLPLLFRLASGRVVPLEPAFLPARLAVAFPALLRSRPFRAAFAASAPLLRARRPGAMLRACDFRGRRSAAMVYASQPIADHFRRVDADSVIGLMDWSGMAQPCFFLLTRDGDPGSSSAMPK